MAFIPAKCTQCGANIEVDDTHEAGICRHCRTPFVTEKVINNYNKTVINNTTLNVQGLDENNLLKRAISFENEGDIKKALEYYNKVLDINIDNEEAQSAIKRLKQPVAPEKKYIYDVSISEDQAKEIDDLLNNGEKMQAIKRAREMSGLGLKEAKDFIESHRPNKWSSTPSSRTSGYGNINTPSNGTKSGGCYVATCVYGSYDCPEVWTLRRFRDYTLDTTWYGRLFIRCYYSISPSIVKLFGNSNWFKTFWKKRLDSMVDKLRTKGVKDTEYIDKY